MTVESELHPIIQQGRYALGLHVGIVSHIVDDNYTIIAVLSDYPGFYAGDRFELGDTYCLDVCKRRRIMTYPDVASIQEMLKHPVYLSTQLRAYIGAPIMVDDCFWGTLNFSSRFPKQEFADADFQLMESLSYDVASIIKKHDMG